MKSAKKKTSWEKRRERKDPLGKEKTIWAGNLFGNYQKLSDSIGNYCWLHLSSGWVRALLCAITVTVTVCYRGRNYFPLHYSDSYIMKCFLSVICNHSADNGMRTRGGHLQVVWLVTRAPKGATGTDCHATLRARMRER